MESQAAIDFARTLGSNAVLFFASLTVVCLSLTSALWWLVLRRLPGWIQAAQAVVTRLAGHSRFGRWLRLLTPAQWALAHFGAYAALALIALFVGIAAFVELADEIRIGEDMAAFDEAFTAALRESVKLSTLQFFRVVTHLGDVWLLTLLSVSVALFLLWRRNYLLTIGWIIAVGGNGLLVRALKSLFERTRPLHDHGILVQDGWSFPSGHAAGSLAVYAMLIYLLMRGRDLHPSHFPLLLFALLLILLIGFSRVFLQVHYFSDVLAGYVIAATWLAACIGGIEVARRQSHRRAR